MKAQPKGKTEEQAEKCTREILNAENAEECRETQRSKVAEGTALMQRHSAARAQPKGKAEERAEKCAREILNTENAEECRETQRSKVAEGTALMQRTARQRRNQRKDRRAGRKMH